MSEQVMVVGVDGSPATYTALRWALAYAGRFGLRRPLLDAGRVQKLGSCSHRRTGATRSRAKAGAERKLVQVVAAALARIPDGSTQAAVRQSVVRGPAGPVLVGEADGAALLVVGHGPRVAELLHRSVSW
jgi:nucleotide-binding universal stress UspA family protein